MDFTKSLLVNVFWAYYYIDGKLVFMSKNLTKGGLTQKVTSEDFTNGRGGSLFATIGTSKTADIVLSENTFNFGTLAMLNGTEVITGSGTGYSDQVELVAGATKNITLATAPIAGSILNMQCKGVDVTGTLTGSEVVFASGVSADDIVTVFPYPVVTGATTQKILVNASEFPQGGVLVLKTFEVSSTQKILADVEFVCENVKVSGDFKVDTTSVIKSADSDITMKVMQYNEDGDLYRINRIPRV